MSREIWATPVRQRILAQDHESKRRASQFHSLGGVRKFFTFLVSHIFQGGSKNTDFCYLSLELWWFQSTLTVPGEVEAISCGLIEDTDRIFFSQYKLRASQWDASALKFYVRKKDIVCAFHVQGSWENGHLSYQPHPCGRTRKRKGKLTGFIWETLLPSPTSSNPPLSTQLEGNVCSCLLFHRKKKEFLEAARVSGLV